MESIVCETCMHHCQLQAGQWGICRARKNEGGKIVCKNYGQLTSLALDPIEKKPLNRFLPGSLILSAGSYGCNLRCPFCQNHEISMAAEDDSSTAYYAPNDLCELAVALQSKGNIGIAFTYNEPLISWEYVLDTSRLLHECGLKSVVVTNGSASPEILAKILPYVDAMNIDLKGFTPEYYRKLGGDLESVKDFIALASRCCHVELTTLIVPGENDTMEEINDEASWIASLDKDIPLHITRFFPRYKMSDRDATDVRKIFQLVDAAKEHLNYVYAGNV